MPSATAALRQVIPTILVCVISKCAQWEHWQAAGNVFPWSNLNGCWLLDTEGDLILRCQYATRDNHAATQISTCQCVASEAIQPPPAGMFQTRHVSSLAGLSGCLLSDFQHMFNSTFIQVA